VIGSLRTIRPVAVVNTLSLIDLEVVMADFLDETRREIGARLSELRPVVDEYKRLEAAATALEGVPSASRETIRGSTRARSSTPRRRGAPGAKRRGRPKGSGTRGNEALTLVKANPGITIPQLAEKMGIKQNYLYRVLPGLQQEGLVSKEGRGWHPKQAA
jgi:CRP-like cAMP-binding protein